MLLLLLSFLFLLHISNTIDCLVMFRYVTVIVINIPYLSLVQSLITGTSANSCHDSLKEIVSFLSHRSSSIKRYRVCLVQHNYWFASFANSVEMIPDYLDSVTNLHCTLHLSFPYRCIYVSPLGTSVVSVNFTAGLTRLSGFLTMT